MANNKCKECGCVCSKCISSDHDVHLHVEIENLKQRLLERDNHILSMETNFLNEANKFPNGELVATREELLTWQDKYKRLYEAHRRVQRVNQGLEDKLLKLVDVCETDKSTLTKDVATLSHKLADANYTIKKLTEDNERYKNDVALAIQFLQCKPGNFMSQKVETLPNEVQAKVSSYMASKRKPEEKKIVPEVKSIKVPIPTFPPTAMVYSIPKSPNSGKKLEKDAENVPVDIVSAAIVAKILEERERERANVKHCDTCTCSKNIKIIHHNTHHTVSTQTGEYKHSLCLKCNSNLEHSPTTLKIIKSAESKNKNLPIYIHDCTNEVNSLSQNVAKVQPNNFLADNRISISDLCNKTGIDGISDARNYEPLLTANLAHAESVHSNSSNVLLNSLSVVPSSKLDSISLGSNNSKEESYQGTQFFNVNEKILSTKPTVSENSKTLTYTDSFKLPHKTTPTVNEPVHHYLCDKAPHIIEVDVDQVKSDSDCSAKDVTPSSNQQKGPRYCSMRMQGSSKNILLDNTHDNVAPILYTRHDRRVRSDGVKHHDSNSESLSSGDYRNSTVSDSSFHNQRVVEWIENNMDVSTSDNSRSDSLKSLKTSGNFCDIDRQKYAEMENNVKRFLFGESEFLKTVEIGKKIYQNYRDNESSNSAGKNSTSNLRTETEI